MIFIKQNMIFINKRVFLYIYFSKKRLRRRRCYLFYDLREIMENHHIVVFLFFAPPFPRQGTFFHTFNKDDRTSSKMLVKWNKCRMHDLFDSPGMGIGVILYFPISFFISFIFFYHVSTLYGKHIFINPISISLKWPILIFSPLFEKQYIKPWYDVASKMIFENINFLFPLTKTRPA